ncbi:hypothetical protein L1049_026278 [Liquidambar formosana]|uniref:Uncharacterized protein n=1 Tax=Liquidambar formosana TaxID=63359 RepID=A0AAP0NEN5_LIQFO
MAGHMAREQWIPFDGHAQNVSKESDHPFLAAHRPSSRRTNSFSSSSSSSSSFRSSYLSDESPLISPATPLHQFSGVPFSWEKLPGIPKKQTPKKKDPLISTLPLPPPATPPTSKRFAFEDIVTRKKNSATESFRRDPFFAAFVECCKDDDQDNVSVGTLWKGSKVPRNLSDRFGIVNLYTSCKRTCAVSESIIYVPRSSRTSHDLWSRRSG